MSDPSDTVSDPSDTVPDPADVALPSGPVAAPNRCGFVAIIGAPNAGKSTLLNRLVGAKVAIISHKVQTTRVPLRGIAMHGTSQLIFIDTPGIFAPRRRLERAMVAAASSAASDADIVLLLIDAAKGIDASVERILEQLSGSKRPRILALNKVDRVHKETLFALTAELHRRLTFTDTFMISALDGSGVDDLLTHLAKAVPEGHWHYPADEITDATERSTAAEVTRERIYKHLHDELPYQTTVETTVWKELRDGSVRVEQTIYVERDSQKQIVLGEGGRTVKLLSMEARREMGQMFERTVHLFIFVKVRENWENDPERYREMGLDFPKE